MTSHDLPQRLQDLGYSASGSSSLFSDIPISCIPLVSVLVDDLLHSREKVTKLETQVDDRVKDLRIQLARMESMVKRVGDDNIRLRKEMQGKDEKIFELEDIVDEEYKGHTHFSRLIMRAS